MYSWWEISAARELLHDEFIMTSSENSVLDGYLEACHVIVG